jgi:plasmid maintenance system killer protein
MHCIHPGRKRALWLQGRALRSVGKYSIRVNDQFRIVFSFDRGEATHVAIADYHR